MVRKWNGLPSVVFCRNLPAMWHMGRPSEPHIARTGVYPPPRPSCVGLSFIGIKRSSLYIRRCRGTVCGQAFCQGVESLTGCLDISLSTKENWIGPRKREVLIKKSELIEAAKKYLGKKRGGSNPTIPRNPQPKGAGESSDSIYHLVFMILVGVLLCLAIGVLDFLSQETASTTRTTKMLEYRE